MRFRYRSHPRTMVCAHGCALIRGSWYHLAMRRLGILLAAMIVLAVAAAPVQASGAFSCPCHDVAADCPCHPENCDLLGPPAACHCPMVVTLFVSSALAFEADAAHDQWRASPTHRLRGMKTIPPLRPPIPA